jgi:hypothetical protein
MALSCHGGNEGSVEGRSQGRLLNRRSFVFYRLAGGTMPFRRRYSTI